MVRLAFPAFLGKALKWHATLPFNVRNDWWSLEQAILHDYPHRPTSVISPARIQVNDWYSSVSPSSALQSIRSHADWINQARERRKQYEARPDDVIDALRQGTRRANAVAEETLYLAKQAMKQDFFPRELSVR